MANAPRTTPFIERLASTGHARWLIVAGLLQVLATLLVFLSGHFHLMPDTFDTNGIGLPFAIDGVLYQRLITEMAGALREQGISAWLSIQGPFHSRLYSLTFLFLGHLVGNNILAAEPLNLLYYLGILVVVYRLGKEVFDHRVGFLAATIVAVWPSFLLHSTQLIRDSLAILCLLALLLIFARILGDVLMWRRTFLIGIGSVALIILFWLTRGNMWNVLYVALALTVMLLVVKMLREKRLLSTNLVLLSLVSVSILLVPTSIESRPVPGYKPPTALISISSGPTSKSRSFWSRFLTQISARREGFNNYIGKRSNVDSDVNLRTTGELIRYLPRAAEIGLFAPFPRMWFEAGSGGRGVRVLAALETCMMYFLYVPAMLCVWNHRSQLKVWLLALFATLSMVSLGLVVVNVGALFRLRYGFWMLVVVLAVEGIIQPGRKRD